MSVRQAKPVNDPQEWALKRKVNLLIIYIYIFINSI
jgi:hypothetical protein